MKGGTFIIVMGGGWSEFDRPSLLCFIIIIIEVDAPYQLFIHLSPLSFCRFITHPSHVPPLSISRSMTHLSPLSFSRFGLGIEDRNASQGFDDEIRCGFQRKKTTS